MNHRETQHHEHSPPPEVRGKTIVLAACAIGLILNGIALLRLGFPDLAWDDVKATDWLLVAVGITYTVVTAFQLRAMNQTVRVVIRQADISSDTAHQQLRAYVGVEETTAELRHGAYWVHVTIKNAGLTPATMVECFGGVEVGPFPERSNYGYGRPAHPGARAVLLPGGTMEQFLESEIFTYDEGVGIRENLMTLFAYGEIRYIDFFGAERVTTYRVMALPRDLRLDNAAKRAMLVCREGNRMT